MATEPSETSHTLDNSPGKMRRTEVWISRDEIVLFLLYDASSNKRRLSARNMRVNADYRDLLEASVAIRSKISFTNEFKIAIALFEIPVSGWTCLRTEERSISD